MSEHGPPAFAETLVVVTERIGWRGAVSPQNAAIRLALRAAENEIVRAIQTGDPALDREAAASLLERAKKYRSGPRLQGEEPLPDLDVDVPRSRLEESDFMQTVEEMFGKNWSKRAGEDQSSETD